MSTVSNEVAKILRVRRVAKAKATRENWRRVGAKATAYLRGLTLYSDVGLAAQEITCKECGDVTPHAHAFGEVIKLSHFANPHEAALAAALSLTFNKHGSPDTWSKAHKVRDVKARAHAKYKAHVIRFNAEADRNIKARGLLESGNRKAQVRACETLGLDVGKLPLRPIWKDVIAHRSTHAHKVRKCRQPPIQTYRCAP